MRNTKATGCGFDTVLLNLHTRYRLVVKFITQPFYLGTEKKLQY